DTLLRRTLVAHVDDRSAAFAPGAQRLGDLALGARVVAFAPGRVVELLLNVDDYERPVHLQNRSGVGVSVLLRQPQAFEGFGVVPETLQVEDPALAHREDISHLQVRLRAMACATPTHPDGNSLAGVDEVAEQFKCVVIKGLAELLPL